MRRAHHDVGGT